MAGDLREGESVCEKLQWSTFTAALASTKA